MRVVSLVSGGIDSMVMAKILQRQGFDQLPVYINYGQRTLEREWEACKAILAEMGLSAPRRVELEGYGAAIASGLTRKDGDYRKDAYVPGRNLLFLIIASAIGLTEKIDTISIGLIASGPRSFPDQTEDFVLNANFALNSAFGTSLKVLTPVFQYGKRDVIQLAANLKLPLAKTYSCQSGNEEYCGECVSCRDILESNLSRFFPRFHSRDC